MNRGVLIVSTLLAFSFCELSSAASNGLFFNVSGAQGQLTITTTIPNHFYPAAGIQLTSPGYTLKYPGSECHLDPNGFCLFPVSNTQPAYISFNGPVGVVNFILCLNGKGPLSCQNYRVANPEPPPPPPPPAARFAYIAAGLGQPTGFLTLCSIYPTGDLLNCHNTGANFVFPSSITFNSAGTVAYVGDESFVWRCNVDQTSGELSACTPTNLGIVTALALNPAETRLYVTVSDITDKLYICNVDASGVLSNCTQDLSFAISNPTNIRFRSPTQVYIGNLFSFLNICTINDATGNLISCTPTGINATTDIALNSTGNKGYITTFTGGSGQIYSCDVNPISGAVTGCTLNATGFSVPHSIVLNFDGTIAYVTDVAAGTVSKCAINTTTGALFGCTVTGSSVPGAEGIALQ